MFTRITKQFNFLFNYFTKNCSFSLIKCLKLNQHTIFYDIYYISFAEAQLQCIRFVLVLF